MKLPKSENDKYITKRSFNEKNKQSFKVKLNEIDWSAVKNVNCPQSAYTSFHKKLTTIFENCFPSKTTKIGYQNRHPWITSLRYPTSLNVTKYKNGLAPQPFCK